MLQSIIPTPPLTLGSTPLPFGAATTTVAGLTLTSPALTGVPTGPTAAPGTNTTQLATTAYAQATFAAPPAIGGTTPAAASFTGLTTSGIANLGGLNVIGNGTTSNLSTTNNTVTGGNNYLGFYDTNLVFSYIGYAGTANRFDVVNSNAAGIIAFAAGGFTPNAYLLPNGNFLIGTSADGGQKLQVNGTSSLIGDVTFGALAVAKSYTIATLPAGVDGAIAQITDQLTTPAAKGVAPTVGGSVHCLVHYNNAAWVGV